MKVLIYGAGSIGCYIGAILHNQGIAVSLLGRSRIKSAIEQNKGVGISDFEGRQTRVSGIDFEVSPAALAAADVILVTLKCTAIGSAIAELKQYCGKNTLVVCLQNGVGAAEQVKQALPEHQVYTGITPFNVVQQENAHFHRATEGNLYLPNIAALEPIQAAFVRYGLGCERRDDIDAVIWGKLLLNLNNAINALSDVPLKQQLEQRGYRRVLAACQQELLLLCQHHGYSLAKLTAVKPDWLPVILRLPDWLFKRIAQKMLAIDPKARSSMWEDVQAGRKTEIHFLNGAVARLCEQAGISATANRTVTQLIEAVEQQQLTPGLSSAVLWQKIQA